MLMLRERRLNGRSNPDCGRVGRPQLRILALQILELTEQLVVFAVGELWSIEYVVLV